MAGALLNIEEIAAAAAVKQPGYGFAAAGDIKPVPQWACACGFPNLDRSDRCGGCGEAKPASEGSLK